MSRILRIAIAVLASALVVLGAIVVYRETDLMTGSLVVLAGLMIAALFARRVAEREERKGMADWKAETAASSEAATELFSEWAVSRPLTERDADAAPASPHQVSPAPTVAPPVPSSSNPPASVIPTGAEVPQPDDPSVAFSRPLHEPDDDDAASYAGAGSDRGALDLSELTDHRAEEMPPPAPAPAPMPAPAPTPAYAGATLAGHSSPIDWTGQGGRVDERVQSTEDILRASEATALSGGGDSSLAGGSELARLLAKVESRLRDYD